MRSPSASVHVVRMCSVMSIVARGRLVNMTLYVGVTAGGSSSDEVSDPLRGHVLAVDMGDRGARAHG